MKFFRLNPDIAPAVTKKQKSILRGWEYICLLNNKNLTSSTPIKKLILY